MDFYPLLTILLAGITYAQMDHPPLKVKFDNSAAREVPVGQSLKFVCTINRDLIFVINNVLQIVRKPEGGGAEVILTQGTQKIEAEPSAYSVSFAKRQDDFTSLEFEIHQVRDLDEGILTCRFKPSDARSLDESGEDSVDIIVMRPFDALYLKFDGLDAISHSIVDPIEVESGEHTVKCIAEGSNPATSQVKLYLHGNDLEIDTKTTRMETPVLKYRTTVTGKVHLTVANTMQEFQCTAISQLQDSHKVKLLIKLKVYDPKIVCNDSDAYKGKWYPILTCTVDYEGLNITRFKYELGNSESVHEGHRNKDFVEVERQQISGTKARVLLKLYQAEDWHFKTNFYLVAEHADGHITRESVRLREVPGRGASRGGNDGASLLRTSVATLIISLWCAFKLLL